MDTKPIKKISHIEFNSPILVKKFLYVENAYEEKKGVPIMHITVLDKALDALIKEEKLILK